MIRNILYSLFIHSILVILIYFSFNPNLPQIEVDKNLKVAVSFITKAGNSVNNDFMPKQPPMTAIPNEMPKPLPEEIKPKTKPDKTPPIVKPKKSKPKPKKPKPKKSDVKKLEIAKKSQPKQEEKNFKPKQNDAKSDENKIKEPDKKDDFKQDENKKDQEKPKPEEKKPEIKEEIKKEETNKVEPDKENLDLKTDDNKTLEDSPEAEFSFTENSIENLDLLFREKFNIQTQIKRCYKKALEESGEDGGAVINAHIFISKDGFIDLDVVVFKIPSENIKNGAEDAKFIKSQEIVKQALKFCSPLRNLPMDKYDIWKEIDLQFD